jgi:heptosyltransferase III
MKLKHLFGFFIDDFRNHVIKSKISYIGCCLKIFLISILYKKIVVISLVEHIGDIIANEPISREVRKNHSDSKVIWVARKPFKELLLYNPYIDYVIPVYCLTTWITIRENWRFEAVYDLHFNGRSCNICHIPLIKENTNDIVNHTNYFNYGGLLRSVCLHNKIEISESTPRIYIPSKIVIRSEQFLPKEKFIAISCSSNESVKDWDKNKWDQLVKVLINDYKYHVVEVGSISKLNVDSDCYHNLCGKLSILESSAVIRKARLFIGIDSGPAHMANAMGTPGIILLGEYYFGMKNYNPYSGSYGSLINCRIINSSDVVKSITIDSILKNINELLSLA